MPQAKAPQQKLEEIRQFMPVAEYNHIKSCMDGEEGQYFIELTEKLHDRIANMPDVSVDQSEIAFLHYFHGASDWYIAQKDMIVEGDDPGVPQGVLQAFGYARLNGDTMNAEYGYISIKELTDCGVDLDLYFEPTPMNTIIQNMESESSIGVGA